MKIQNTNLAGEKLTLRFAIDEDGNRITAQGDAEGVFDVPERDANHLLKTKGWKVAEERRARGLDGRPTVPQQPVQQQGRIKPPLAPPMPVGALTAPTQPAPPPLKEQVAHGPTGAGAPAASEEEEEEAAGSDADKDSDEETEDGPDIEAIRTKAAAMELAKEYGIDTLNEEMKLSEMKQILESELYGDEAKVPGPTKTEEAPQA